MRLFFNFFNLFLTQDTSGWQLTTVQQSEVQTFYLSVSWLVNIQRELWGQFTFSALVTSNPSIGDRALPVRAFYLSLDELTHLANEADLFDLAVNFLLLLSISHANKENPANH